MLWTDLIALAALLAFALSWSVTYITARAGWLTVLALIALAASLMSFLGGRGLAGPALTLSGAALLGIAIAAARNPGLLSEHRPRRPMLTLALLLLTGVCAFPLLALYGRVDFPEPPGPFEVGVREGVISDATRGQGWDAVSDPPRRTIVRVWYPARSGSGFRRARRLDRQQVAAAREFFDILGMGTYTFLADGLGHTMTNARQDAPAADGSFPLLLFSHGYYGDVSTNALLMETLASRGFVVASISHPGESSAMVYPGGTWFRLSPRGIEARRQTSGPGSDIRPDFEAIANGDVQARADYVTWYNSREITTQRAPIWIDDFRAMLDAIEDGATGAKLGPAFSSADLTHVGFLGMSMGALTAPAACHQDRRCGAAAALDVGGGMPALRDARSRVPMLVFTADQPIRGGGQDFYYEPNATAGLDPRTHRFTLNGSTHWDFTDFALVLKPWMRRLGWIPGFGTSPGEALQAAQSRLIADFFDTYLKGEDRGFPEAALAEHPLAIEDDLSAIRAWAGGDL